MPAEYHYARNGQRFGPVNGKQLRELAAAGKLLPTDQIWSPEKNQWIPAGTIKALFPQAAAAVPAQVPAAVPKVVPHPIGTSPRPTPVRWGMWLGIGGGTLAALGLIVGLVVLLNRPGTTTLPSDTVVLDDKGGKAPLPMEGPGTTVPETKGDAGKEAKKDPGPIDPKGFVEPKKDPVSDTKTEVNPAAQAKVEQGNAAAAKGDLEAAIRAYTEAIELQPNYAWAYCKRGQAHMNKGAYAAAIADCNKALEFQPKLMDAYAFRGASEYDGKDYPAAIVTSDQALKLDPRAPFFYFLRGNALVMTGSPERGITDLDQAIRLDPKNARYFHSRGSAHAKLKNDKLAQADFEQRDALDLAAMSPAKRQAYQRMQQAEADFQLAAAQYEGAQRAYDVQMNTYRAQAGRAAAMGIKLRPPAPPDPFLQNRMQNARAIALQARRTFETTP